MKYFANIAIGLFSLCSYASAAVVTLEFSGTYDTQGDSVFGEQGAAVPYLYTITYDTDIGDLLFYYPAGASLDGKTTIDEWYGYSASGITATNLTFGTATWTAANISASMPAAGIAADLWFNADLTIEGPTKSWIVFRSPGTGDLSLGSSAADAETIFLSSRSNVMQMGGGIGMASSSNMTISTIPEPSVTALLIGTTILAFAFVRNRSRLRKEKAA